MNDPNEDPIDRYVTLEKQVAELQAEIDQLYGEQMGMADWVQRAQDMEKAIGYALWYAEQHTDADVQQRLCDYKLSLAALADTDVTTRVPNGVFRKKHWESIQ